MKIFIISVLFAIGFLTAACPAPCDMKDEEIKAVHAELSPVVEAIENYRKDQKSYPRTIQEISPKYLDKLPPTVGGRKFEYITTADNRYNIRINAANGGSYSGSCSYDEIEDHWNDLKDK